jgi:alcohol dehydrogenase YqhD (iron-dependent ADH family)
MEVMILQYSIFQSPRNIIYGEGSLSVIGRVTEKFGKKIMVITGKSSSKKSGALDKIIYSLKEKNWIM